jgi:peptide deformylase
MGMSTEYPLTLAVAAKEIGVSIQALYWHINIKKDLPASRLGNLTVINPEVWAKFKAGYEKGARR